MLSRHGPIRQLGYVVRDIEAALTSWADRLRIGPWFYNPDVTFRSSVYRGLESAPLKISYALANSGDMQIELIEQLCLTPSVYREHLERHGEGLHHLCVWPEDYDRSYALARASGLASTQEGTFGKIRFAYFEDAAHAGTSLEISEMVPERLPVIEAIRRAAVDWHGVDPVRPYPGSAAAQAMRYGQPSRI